MDSLLRGWSLGGEGGEGREEVRVFLSSTFHDFAEERAYLWREVLPDLDHWCEGRGLRLRIVDMRWGVRSNVSQSHSGAAMCLREVDLCRRLSVGTAFVAFLGQRYGNRPLPAALPREHFALAAEEAAGEEEEALLKTFYPLDLNSVPPQHLLTGKGGAEEWAVLRRLVKGAAAKLTAPHTYLLSVTEREIRAMLEGNEELFSTTLAFMRHFKDQSLQIDPNIKRVRKYVDFNADSEDHRNPEAEQKVESLKSELRDRLAPENIASFEVEFDPRLGINPHWEAHEAYLKNFGRKFSSGVRRQVEAALGKERKRDRALRQLRREGKAAREPGRELEEEVGRHAAFVEEKAPLYCGHDSVLDELERRLSETETAEPLLLHALSGAGKTATVARLVARLSQRAPDQGLNVVYRFLGTSPASSNLRLLLSSLLAQLRRLYPSSGAEVPADLEETKGQLLSLLWAVGGDAHSAPLILILDSLDQLSDDFGAHRMDWLPKEVGPRLGILASVSPKLHGILERLRSRQSSESFFQLPSFTPETALNVFKDLLGERKRSLTEAQMALVAEALEGTPTPLLIQLTLLETRSWTSFTEETSLGSTPEAAIDIILEGLEKRHGRLLVSHALSFLVLSSRGVTEGEMEELLSLDDEVLDDVYQFWPPTREAPLRLPPLLWARLRQELDQMVVLREEQLLGLYHSQFTAVIRKRYSSVKKLCRGLLIDFFEGTYSEKPKAINLTVMGEEAEWRRAVREQPLRLPGPSPALPGAWNRRKLVELPHLLASARRWEDLATECLLHFHFINATEKALGVEALLADYALLPKKLPDSEPVRAASLVGKAVALAAPTLAYEDNEDVLATELLGRLLAAETEYPSLESLLYGAKFYCEEILVAKEGRLMLVPENQAFAAPGGSLVSTLTSHSAAILALAGSGSLLASSSEDGLLLVHKLGSTAPLHSLQFAGQAAQSLALADKDWLFGLTADGLLHRVNVRTGLALTSVRLADLQSKAPRAKSVRFQDGSPREAQHHSPPPSRRRPRTSNREIKPDGAQPDQKQQPVTCPSVVFAYKDRICLLHNSQLLIASVSDTGDLELVKKERLEETVHSVRMDASGRLFVSLGPDGLLCYNVAGRSQTRKVAGFREPAPESASVLGVAARGSCLIAVCAGGAGAFVHVSGDASGPRPPRERVPLEALDGEAPLHSAFHDSTVAVASLRRIVLLDVFDQEERCESLESEADMSLVAFADGLLVVGTADDAVRVYDPREGLGAFRNLLPGLWGAPTLALALSGPQLVTVATAAPFIKVWELSKPTEPPVAIQAASLRLPPVTCAHGRFLSVASADLAGTSLKVSGPTGKTKAQKTLEEPIDRLIALTREQVFWSTADGKVYALPINAADTSEPAMIADLRFKVIATTKGPNSLHFLLLDAKRLVEADLASSHFTELPLAESLREEELRAALGHLAQPDLLLLFTAEECVGQSREGKVLLRLPVAHSSLRAFACGSGVLATLAKSGEVALWEAKRQRWTKRMDLKGTCLAVSPDDRLIVVGSGKSAGVSLGTRQLRVLSCSDGSTLRRKAYMYFPVRSVAFHGSDSLVVGMELGNFALFRLHLPRELRMHRQQMDRHQGRQKGSVACVVL